MNRNRSESTANRHLANRADRVRARMADNRDVLWRAAWLRINFNMADDDALEQAEREAAALIARGQS